jgi:hypothetical protein
MFQGIRNLDNLRDIFKTFFSNPIIHDKIKALKLKGLFDTKMNYMESVDLFISLRDIIPADVLLIASGSILPYEYAFLISVGIDAID